MITYCRMRRVQSVSAALAESLRREGTTTIEIPSGSADDIQVALAAGLLATARIPACDTAAAWVVGPAGATVLAESGVPGWRITMRLPKEPVRVPAALALAAPAFLRAGRSRVREAAGMVPCGGTVVSTFVDTVGEALEAVAEGAGDLILRDWDSERLWQLRQALGGTRLVERTAFPPGLDSLEASSVLQPPVLKAYLDLVDGSGAARPRDGWAPGKDLPPPQSYGRCPDGAAHDLVASGLGRRDGVGCRASIGSILDRSLSGRRPTRDEVALLLSGAGPEVKAVAAVADELRRRVNGETVTYVVNRNINYTNRCIHRCGFCAFSRAPRSGPVREAPYLLELSEVARLAAEAWGRGASEVCLQGGIHPSFNGGYYLSILEAVRAAAPDIHIHAFSPLEIWQGAATLGVGVSDYLARLRGAGLGSLPGTAAEVLDDRIRSVLCPGKIGTAEWIRVVAAAHDLGIPSTATVMFGHIDSPQVWADHFEVLRRLQARTGGFTEFVPLPFVHMEAPIYLEGRSRPGPTWDEVVLVHAVARIAFDGLIPNIQASWVKLGLDGAASLLWAGCNDLGGTLMGESISRAAGGAHGSEVGSMELEGVIRSAGRLPMQRSTLYRPAAGQTLRSEVRLGG
jgi:FO synthase